MSRSTPVLLLLAACAPTAGSVHDTAAPPAAWPAAPSTEAVVLPVPEAFPGEVGEPVQVVLSTPQGRSLVPAEVIDGVVVAGGDMVLGPAEALTLLPADLDLEATPPPSAGRDLASWRWTDGQVPFVISGALSPAQTTSVLNAMANWSAVAPVSFVPRSGEAAFINIVRSADANSCWADIGRVGLAQTVSLGDNCFDVFDATPTHELGHALGLFHEHTRSDRDSFVTITLGNVQAFEEDNFWRYDSWTTGDDIGSYDLSSIMHYPSWAFSNNCDLSDLSPCSFTITTTSGGTIFSNVSISAGDAWGVTRMYADTWQISDAGTSPWATAVSSQHPLAELGFGDFDGDGRTDVFRGSGSRWRVSDGGTSSWRVVNSSGVRTASLDFCDFDGDGEDDVFWATGSRWRVSFSGTSAWSTLNTSGVTDVALGDFDGNGRCDVLRTTGSTWRVSWNGTGTWDTVRSSSIQLNNLVFGDFDGDGATDALTATGSRWFVSWGAQSSWDATVSSGVTEGSMAVGDFDGDGADDIFARVGASWRFSSGAQASWQVLQSSGYSASAVAVGDFDGDGVADVFTTMEQLVD